MNLMELLIFAPPTCVKGAKDVVKAMCSIMEGNEKPPSDGSF